MTDIKEPLKIIAGMILTLIIQISLYLIKAPDYYLLIVVGAYSIWVFIPNKYFYYESKRYREETGDVEV